MKCPQGHKLAIISIKNAGDIVQRRRCCRQCDYWVSTDERIVERPPSPGNKGCLWPMPHAQALAFAIHAVDATTPNGAGHREWADECRRVKESLVALRDEVGPGT
jgi:hypothetical protein